MQQKVVAHKAAFELPPLPWPTDALAPAISRRTIEFHYGRHHRTYVEKLNGLVEGTPYAEMPLEEVVRQTCTDESRRDIFHNAAQAWNHSFFWTSLTPRPGRPSEQLRTLIEGQFGGLMDLNGEFAKAAEGQFGSGWAWLVFKDGKLSVQKTANADTPMMHGHCCLLTIDVWEHAYYLDYQNKRPEYAKAVLNKLDWTRASERLKAETG